MQRNYRHLYVADTSGVNTIKELFRNFLDILWNALEECFGRTSGRHQRNFSQAPTKVNSAGMEASECAPFSIPSCRLYAYKLQILQHLTPGDKPRRKRIAVDLLHWMMTFLKVFCSLMRHHSVCSGHINWYNVRIWGRRCSWTRYWYPESGPFQQFIYPQHLMVTELILKQYQVYSYATHVSQCKQLFICRSLLIVHK